MKKLLRLIFAVAFVGLFISCAFTASAQTTRYVSTSGTDIGTCPVGSPCATINYAIQVAESGDLVLLAAGTYGQQVNISKAITLQGAGAGTDPNQHTIITGDAPVFSGRGINLAAGVTHVTIKDLRVQRFGTGSGIYGQGNNNYLNIQNVQVYENTGTTSAEAGIHLNGPIAEVNLQGIDAQYNSTRGIVIWNGRKEHITITNCIVSHNSLAGLELQDGTASGVTITNNTVEYNKDSGISVVGLSGGAGANLVAGNTVVNNGRFGIEVKLPAGNGLETGDGSILLKNNLIKRTEAIAASELRDLAGIAVYRRSWTPDNVDVPQGVVIKENNIVGYQQNSISEGFGIVVEGTNMQVTNNTVSDCEVAIQMQAGHLPYFAQTATDGDQSNLADQYFGRGNTPGSSGVIQNNTFLANITNTRYVGLPEPATIEESIWAGTQSSEWTSAANWREEIVPLATTDVMIPANTPYAPVVTSNQALKSLRIAPGATLQVHAGKLQVNGDLQNEGALLQAGTGNLEFTGTQEQVIGGTEIIDLENLTVGAAGVSLTGPVKIKNKLVLNGTLSTNGYPLTLSAGTNGTAQVIQQEQGHVTGQVTMERLIPVAEGNKNAYSLFASPFTNFSWQQLLVSAAAESQSSAEVYDYKAANVTPNPLELANFRPNWVKTANPAEILSAGQGFRVNWGSAEKVALTGTLQNGPILVSNLSRGKGPQQGWHLLGNPYAAPLDWRRVEVPAGMSKALYTLAASGRYNSYVNGIGTAPQAHLVPIMDGFFVQVQEGPVNFRFDPNQLVNAISEIAPPVMPEQRPILNLQLIGKNARDETIIYFETGATNQTDPGFDAYKLLAEGNNLISLYSKAGPEKLSINGLSPITTNLQTSVPLGLAGVSVGSYTLQVNQILNFDSAIRVVLEDRETGLLQDLRQNPGYTFQIDNKESDGRFIVHFSTKEIIAAPGKRPTGKLLVYPNPTPGKLQLSLSGLKPTGELDAVVYNSMGRAVYRQMLPIRYGRVQQQINLTGLKKGVYVLHLDSELGAMRQKIVIE